MNLGIEIELSVLLFLTVVGAGIFSPFEVETPAWRKMLKWAIVISITLGLYSWVGHWAILVPIVLGLFGLAFHFLWCARNQIHPLRALPRRRYYQLRGWEWPDEK